MKGGAKFQRREMLIWEARTDYFAWKLPAKIRISYGSSKRIRISRLSGVPCARRSKGSGVRARVCASARVNAAGPACVR